jgi:hypothetical protein
VLRDCFFDSNVAVTNAGAVNGANLTIERCVFVGNLGYYGGAVSCGASMVRDCLFVGNASELGGGAITVGFGGAAVQGCTFVGNHLHPGNVGGAAIYSVHGVTTLRNNVIAESWGATAVDRLANCANCTITSSCNVFWANADGDWSGFTPDATDRVIDPEFCDPGGGDYTVRSTSPCLPENSLGCGLIGAYGEGCGVVSVEPTSFGRIKAAHRDGAGGEP